MAPIVLVGYVVSVIGGLVHLATDVVGLDVSLKTLGSSRASLTVTSNAPVTPVAEPRAGSPPTCPPLTHAMDEAALNEISLRRALGRCR